MTILTTERMLLRPWREDDAASLYEYAKDPRVGPVAGWPVHTDVAFSRAAIRDYLSAEGIFAVTLKETDAAIGSIGFLFGEASNFEIADHEGEIGYWIGVPFWGRGLIPEAMREVVRHGFEDLALTTIWCGYFDENTKSRRVQEKCGFRYHHTETDKKIALVDAVQTEHVTCMTKEQWLRRSENYRDTK